MEVPELKDEREFMKRFMFEMVLPAVRVISRSDVCCLECEGENHDTMKHPGPSPMVRTFLDNAQNVPKSTLHSALNSFFDCEFKLNLRL